MCYKYRYNADVLMHMLPSSSVSTLFGSDNDTYQTNVNTYIKRVDIDEDASISTVTLML